MEKKLSALEIGNPSSSLERVLLLNVIYSGSLVLFTIMTKDYLLKFILNELSAEELEADKPNDINYEVKFERRKATIIYVVRISATYFSKSIYHSNLYNESKTRKLKPDVQRPEVANIAQFNKEAVNILRSHNKLKLNSFEVNFRRNSLSLVYKTAPKENLLKISLHETDEVDKEDYAKSLPYSCNDLDSCNLAKDYKMRNIIEKQEMCLMCFDGEPDAVIMGCGHGGVCYDCVLKSWEKKDKCYMCRGNIESVLKVQNYYMLGISKAVEEIVKVKVKPEESF